MTLKLTQTQNYNDFLTLLVNISLDGLKDMFIPSKLAFAGKRGIVHDKMINSGLKTKYTLISLLGLQKAENHGLSINIDLRDILNNQIKICNKYRTIGEIGLLLWAAALISPESINKILIKINFDSILSKYPDSKKRMTMELSWFLTGLLMASTFNKTFKSSIGELPLEVYKIIRNNFSGSGIFRHQSNSGISGKLRGDIASFADQAYPVYAFSLFSKLKQNEEAMLIAKECALTICKHQGQSGEWPWHYNSSTGNVLNRYPIYSVQQDAIAPMALFAIQKASNTNFEEYIFKGLDWMVKQDSPGFSVVNEEDKQIWHSMGPKKTGDKISSKLAYLGFNKKSKIDNFEVVKECWSYHFGWLLYAFAGRTKNNTEVTDHKQKEYLKLYNFRN